MRHTLRAMIPARVEPPKAVRQAAQCQGHAGAMSPDALTAGILDGLRELAGTAGPVVPLPLDADAAWDAVLAGLLAPGDRVLTIEGGPCGRALTQAGARAGLDMSAVTTPPGRSLDAEVLERALATDTSFKAVLLPAVEAATGAAHSLADLAGVASAHGVLMLVDGSHFLGVSEVRFDDWGLAALVAPADAGLMQPPGLTAIALSDSARQGLEGCGDCEHGVPELTAAVRACRAGTLPQGVAEAAAPLHAAVAELAAQGMAAVAARNAACASMCRAGVSALGLGIVSHGPHADALTAVRLPAGVSAELLALAMGEEYGVLAQARSDGPGELANRVLCLAHHAPLDFGDVLAALAALRACLPLVGGHSACRDALETAMHAYDQSLYGPEAGQDD